MNGGMDSTPSGASGGVLCAYPGARSTRRRSAPSASASLTSVGSVGRTEPRSMRLISLRAMPLSLASCFWVRPPLLAQGQDLHGDRISAFEHGPQGARLGGIELLAISEVVVQGLAHGDKYGLMGSLGRWSRYDVPMATKLRLDPDLAAVVERARRRAVEMGELPPGPFLPYEPKISSEVADVILEMLRDGTYAEAVARIAAEDPELADQ